MQMCFTKKVCITCHKGQSFWDPCKCANPRSDWPPNSPQLPVCHPTDCAGTGTGTGKGRQMVERYRVHIKR